MGINASSHIQDVPAAVQVRKIEIVLYKTRPEGEILRWRCHCEDALFQISIIHRWSKHDSRSQSPRQPTDRTEFPKSMEFTWAQDFIFRCTTDGVYFGNGGTCIIRQTIHLLSPFSGYHPLWARSDANSRGPHVSHLQISACKNDFSGKAARTQSEYSWITSPDHYVRGTRVRTSYRKQSLWHLELLQALWLPALSRPDQTRGQHIQSVKLNTKLCETLEPKTTCLAH